MQHMKDKEFDQLFRNKLEDAELQPSANLWNNIAVELKPHKKREFPVYWIAAAVAVIVLSAVLLAPDKEKIRLQGAASVASSSLSGTSALLHEHSTAVSKIDTNAYASTPLVIAPRLNEAAASKEFIAMQPKVTAARHIVNQTDSIPVYKKRSIAPAVIVDQDLVIARADVPDDINANVITETEPSVNYVASKADKSEHKILSFNTDDDSSLVGINLGFIRLNLKRYK